MIEAERAKRVEVSGKCDNWHLTGGSLVGDYLDKLPFTHSSS